MRTTRRWLHFNPYGDGHAAERIAANLSAALPQRQLRRTPPTPLRVKRSKILAFHRSMKVTETASGFARAGRTRPPPRDAMKHCLAINRQWLATSSRVLTLNNPRRSLPSCSSVPGRCRRRHDLSCPSGHRRMRAVHRGVRVAPA
jgi:hypothetical protein